MSSLLIYVLVLFVIAALFRVDFFFYVLYLLFGVYLVGRVWTEQALKRVSYRFDYPERVFIGEHATVRLSLVNQSALLIPWMRLHESTPVQLRSAEAFEGILSLRPYEQRELSYELDCRNRGMYLLGPLTLDSGDLFGMSGARRLREDGQRRLLVYPRVVPLTDLGLPAQSPFGGIPVKDRLYEDPTRMIGVREYVPGDSLRRIHWRTSAATGKLQVKRFEPAISIEAQIILDLCRQDYGLTRYHTASELGIVTAASFAAHLIGARQSVGLACNGADPLSETEGLLRLDPGKGQGHLLQVLDLLARVRLSGGPAFADTLRQASLSLSWGGTAIVVAPDVDDLLFGVLLWMKRRGLHVMALITDPKQPFDAFRARAGQVGIDSHLIWQEGDLDAWRQRGRS